MLNERGTKPCGDRFWTLNYLSMSQSLLASFDANETDTLMQWQFAVYTRAKDHMGDICSLLQISRCNHSVGVAPISLSPTASCRHVQETRSRYLSWPCAPDLTATVCIYCAISMSHIHIVSLKTFFVFFCFDKLVNLPTLPTNYTSGSISSCSTYTLIPWRKMEYHVWSSQFSKGLIFQWKDRTLLTARSYWDTVSVSACRSLILLMQLQQHEFLCEQE